MRSPKIELGRVDSCSPKVIKGIFSTNTKRSVSPTGKLNSGLLLEPVEQKELEKILSRHSTSQQVAKRVKIILMASEGKNHRAIARELEISRKMARLWRDRWLELKEKDVSVRERLLDAPRPGKPTQFTTEQVLQLFSIACESPEKYGRPISHWTSRELAEELVRQKIVESISPRHVARLL